MGSDQVRPWFDILGLRLANKEVINASKVVIN